MGGENELHKFSNQLDEIFLFAVVYPSRKRIFAIANKEKANKSCDDDEKEGRKKKDRKKGNLTELRDSQRSVLKAQLKLGSKFARHV